MIIAEGRSKAKVITFSISRDRQDRKGTKKRLASIGDSRRLVDQRLHCHNKSRE